MAEENTTQQPQQSKTLDDYISALAKSIQVEETQEKTDLEKALESVEKLQARVQDLEKAKKQAPPPQADENDEEEEEDNEEEEEEEPEIAKALQQYETGVKKASDDDAVDGTAFLGRVFDLTKAHFETEAKVTGKQEKRIANLEKTTNELAATLTKALPVMLAALNRLTDAIPGNRPDVMQPSILAGKTGLRKSALTLDKKTLAKALVEGKISEADVKYLKLTGQLPDGVKLQ